MFARALIVLLLVANLGVAAWWLLRAPPAPPALPTLPAGTPGLQLASEAPAKRAVAAPVADTAPQCLAFGPFADAATLAHARAALQPRVAHLQPRSEGVVRGWRVWIAPQADHAAAQALAQRIAAAGFADYYVVSTGAEAHGIALGRFGAEAGARQHAQALQAAGFAAQAEPLPSTGPQWLDVATGAGFDAEAARAASGAPESRAIPCTGLR